MSSLPIEPHVRCPRCNHITDLVAHHDGQPKKPAVGDVVVCIRCAGLLTLTTVGSLRELRDHEYRALSVEQLVRLGEMQTEVAQGHFRRGPL